MDGRGGKYDWRKWKIANRIFRMPLLLTALVRDTGTVQRRKWSPTANDPQTGKDPQIGPQMIPNLKWSQMWTANDPGGKGGMAWSF